MKKIEECKSKQELYLDTEEGQKILSRISLKNIKTGIGHEMSGYSCKLYLDGKPFCQIENDGWGGGLQYYPAAKGQPYRVDLEPLKKAIEECGGDDLNLQGWRLYYREQNENREGEDNLSDQEIENEAQKMSKSDFDGDGQVPEIVDSIINIELAQKEDAKQQRKMEKQGKQGILYGDPDEGYRALGWKKFTLAEVVAHPKGGKDMLQKGINQVVAEIEKTGNPRNRIINKDYLESLGMTVPDPKFDQAEKQPALSRGRGMKM